jgi:hypothetical protein
VEQRLSEIKAHIDESNPQEALTFAEKPQTMEEYDAPRLQMKCLADESSYWEKKFTDCSKMFVNLQNNAPSRVNHLITVKGNKTNEVRDHTWIPEKAIPVLNVKRSVFDDSSATEDVELHFLLL